MHTVIQNGRIIDPTNQLDTTADVYISQGRIASIGKAPENFHPNTTIHANGCLVLPGIIDLTARVGEPGPHAHMLESEVATAAKGGVTSLVCPPDTSPVLDEPGLVQMLHFRAQQLQKTRLFPVGALTKQLEGKNLTGMVELAEAGCIGFGQADAPIHNTQILMRTMQYAATFGYTVWLRPQDPWLGKGVAASGALATRMGLSGEPVLSETIALMTIIALVEETGARVHICRLSSQAGVALIRQAKARHLPISCDVSINNLHLCDNDIGHFDSRTRLTPPLRSSSDRDALRAALQDGTIDALVSDHTPVDTDAKILPFNDAQPGAVGLELLLPLLLHWAQQDNIPLLTALAAVCSRPAHVMQATPTDLGLGNLSVGSTADICICDPNTEWQIRKDTLSGHGRYTPFEGYRMTGRVTHTLLAGKLVYTSAH